MDKLHTILLILLVTSISWIIYLKIEQIPKLNTTSNTNHNSITNLLWNNYVSVLIKDDNVKIDRNISVEDTLLQKIELGSLINKKPKLVFRYSNLDCRPCIEETLKLISESSQVIKDNSIIISDDITSKVFINRNKNFKYSIPLYNLVDQNIGFHFEGKGMPFLFILTEDFRSTCLFTPIKENKSFTKSYLMSIEEKLSK